MKRLLCILLILGGCQATNLSTAMNFENGSNAVATDAVASVGGLSTYGSGSDSASSNTMGGVAQGKFHLLVPSVEKLEGLQARVGWSLKIREFGYD